MPAYASKAGFGETVFVLRCAPNEDWWAWRDLHPQGCQILNLDPLLFGLNHMPS